MDREQVGHELRTPLTVIKGVLELIGSQRFLELPPRAQQELIARARLQTVELETVIAKIEAHFEPVHDENAVVVLTEEPAYLVRVTGDG